MAKYEGEFEAASEAALEAPLLDALRDALSTNARERSETIAFCLSGGEGWRDAAARLGGAFAPAFETTGLTNGKQ